MDVLPDRGSGGLKRWAEAHPGIEYARGVTGGAPEAVQVTDRWHPTVDFRQLLERFFHDEKEHLQTLQGLEVVGSPPVLHPSGAREEKPPLPRQPERLAQEAVQKVESSCTFSPIFCRFSGV